MIYVRGVFRVFNTTQKGACMVRGFNFFQNSEIGILTFYDQSASGIPVLDQGPDSQNFIFCF